MKPKLAILIPTVPDRAEQLTALMRAKFWPLGFTKKSVDTLQDPELELHAFHFARPVILYVGIDNKQMSIGQKRAILYDVSEGEYSWQIDDDDSIANDAIDRILAAIEHRPDCITFQEHCTIDGGFFSSNHSLAYDDWEGTGDIILPDGFNYHRTPFFKDVIRTEIARSIPIPHIRFGEDHEWARALKGHLQTEVHIAEYLYYYQHVSSDHNTRYGITE